MVISFDLENCFGIRRLAKSLVFKDKQPVAVIYAPNGMMKSSFANTLDCLAKDAEAKPKKKYTTAATDEDPIKDRLHPELASRHVVKIDGNEIEGKCIFVANPDQENFDASKQVTDFLGSTALKAKYDDRIGAMEGARRAFVGALSVVMKSSDCEKELITAFSKYDDDYLYDCLIAIRKGLKDDAPYYDFKYNNIFDQGGLVKKFLDENQSLLFDYVKKYTELMDKSDFFHLENGKSFGTYQAALLGKAFKGDEFFKVNHKLLLRNGDEIDSTKAYADRVNEEKKQIFDDESLRKTFDSLTQKLEANGDMRSFEDEITKHPEWIAKLYDYEGFRKEALIGFINHQDVRGLFDALYGLYQKNKAEIRKLIKKAQEEQEQWVRILEIFKARFYVPFDVKIENQQNVLLKQEEARLAFSYKDSIDGQYKTQSRDALMRILSKGEKRAFLILQFLFAIEARKMWAQPSLIVMDDISDSFDYQNKYAIIEYLKDIAENYPDQFKIILLTHNFDFYRSVTLRLKGMVQQYMAVKQNDGTIRIDNGIYVMRTPFELEMKNSQKASNFVALIPFIRNLVEYYQEKNSEDFMTLTNCLHLLENTEEITDTDLVRIFEQVKSHDLKYEPKGERVIDIIFREADKIETADEVHEIMIEDKVILSIAIRLKAEYFLKRELTAAGKTEEELVTRRNQTSEWIDLYKTLNPPTDRYRTMEKVNMMTPEYIHLNSFMYEPLIDMSVWHLIELYKELKVLLGERKC